MIKLSWKMNGRTIHPNQIGAELMKSVRREAESAIEDTVKQARCPVHGKAASNVRLVARADSRINVEYEVCCKELEAAIGRCLA